MPCLGGVLVEVEAVAPLTVRWRASGVGVRLGRPVVGLCMIYLAGQERERGPVPRVVRCLPTSKV